MSQRNQALKVALAAVEQLPVNLQRQLAEQVLQTVAADEVLVVPLQRLTPAENTRLHELMDKNNDGLLTKAERQELEQLGAKVDGIMLENSKLLAFIARPELFDEAGNPIKRRLRAAVKASAAKQNGKRRKAKSD
jgi:hypothetical protein